MSEDQEEYDEVVVYAEFSGLVESGESFWSSAPDHVGVLGLDTESPLLQIGEVTFRGAYEDSVGSLMFFEGQQNDATPSYGVPSSVPPLVAASNVAQAAAASGSSVSDKTSYKYTCHTDKILPMKRIFLQPKASSVVHSKASGDLDAEVERCQSLSGVGEDDDEDGDTMDMNTGAVQ